jgi:hypothetical protein
MTYVLAQKTGKSSVDTEVIKKANLHVVVYEKISWTEFHGGKYNKYWLSNKMNAMLIFKSFYEINRPVLL